MFASNFTRVCIYLCGLISTKSKSYFLSSGKRISDRLLSADNKFAKIEKRVGCNLELSCR